jgi:hypothetical protein
MTYRDEVHDGEHPAIVDAPTFETVQHLLKRNGATGGAPVRNRYGALLRGILRCVPCGCGMVHSYTIRKGKTRYRYYVCQNAQSRGWRNCPAPSVPAAPIEQFVVGDIRLNKLIKSGQIADQAELARLGQVTRARVTQIMNLLHLAPDIQEALLFLPLTTSGRDPIRERMLRPIAAVLDWRKQRGMWKQLLTEQNVEIAFRN